MKPVFTRNILPMLLLLVGTIGCIEPYDPPTGKNNPDFLVVDAFIDGTASSAYVKLTRTLALSSTEHPAPELNATVRLVVNDGTSFDLASSGPGIYEQFIPIDFEKRYTLYIVTSSGKEYQSEAITIKRTPAIDSINYFIDEYDELNINVNTHDPEASSRFYRWTYEQTFKYRSPLTSNYIKRPSGEITLREPSEFIDVCYKTDYLTRIIIGSSKLLTQDVIRDLTLLKFRKRSLEISEKYSILVKQQTLSEEAYDYWLNIKKTTETLGGLFDPLPGEVFGNIHCTTDPAEPVIGYFSGSQVTEKRIFISKFDLPNGFSYFEYPYCHIDSIPERFVGTISTSTYIIAGIYPPGSLRPTGFTISSPTCADCRSFGGGVLEKPDFWE